MMKCEEEKKEEKERPPELKVLIVGAGLAGLSTALALVRRNDAARVEIVERRPDFAGQGATFGLNVLAQRALGELDPSREALLRALVEKGVRMPTGGYMLPWGAVRDGLLREVRDRADRISLHLGVSIERVAEREADGDRRRPLVATFRDSDLTIDADVLIGADGVNSFVRTEILALPPPTPTGAHVWRGGIDTEAFPGILDEFAGLSPFGHTVKFVLFGDALQLSYFNFHPKVDGAVAWVFCAKTDNLPQEARRIEPGTTTPQHLLRSYMASVKDPDAKLRDNYDTAMKAFDHATRSADLAWSSEMKVVDLTAADGRWGGRGGITLVGDAAHALRPASGLGGGLAFEDAALLGPFLAECRGGEDAASQLRRFEALRLPRCKSLSNDQSLRSELSYKVGYHKVPQWDPNYSRWIDEGFEALPEPPVSEVEVFVNAGLI